MWQALGNFLSNNGNTLANVANVGVQGWNAYNQNRMQQKLFDLNKRQIRRQEEKEDKLQDNLNDSINNTFGA